MITTVVTDSTIAGPEATVRRDGLFDEVYTSCAPRVRGLVRRLVADAGLVEDIVQETFLRGYANTIHVDDEDPWPWLAAVARNLCLDALRRRQIITEDPLDADDESLATAVVPTTPEREVMRSAEAAHVHEALSALSPRQRRILVLKHLRGWRYQEIAEVESLTDDALKSILARARRNFRRQYLARTRERVSSS
jgi:RNA polymerase sigma-70 factor (ECF subfamily)